MSASLLASYDHDLFVPHRQWVGLEEILATRRGGSYGLAGPRGSGKTWAMQEAKTWAEEKDGISVWFPSPSEYEPMAFLAAISDVVAIAFEQYYDERTGRTTRASAMRFRAGLLGSVVMLYIGAALIAFSGRSFNLGRYLNFTSLTGIALVLSACVLAIVTYQRRRTDREGLGRLRRAAEDLRMQVRYIVTTKESSEIGGEASRAGVKARVKRAKERQLVERPATLSSLIHNFRAFVGALAKEVSGPIVIAVDELDKMSDAALVADLLRDIKGIFDISGGVYFLVSISDEAARSLELGPVRTRNEFNSSFYTVISFPALRPDECQAILRRRSVDFDEKVALAVGVLTGGIPREVVRVADRARELHGKGLTLEAAVITEVREEADAFLRDVLTSSAGANATSIGPGERLALFRAITTLIDAPDTKLSLAACGALSQWNVNEKSRAWQRMFQEEWRRLLVRLVVAGLILRSPARLDRSDRDELQRIIRVASGSAPVARTLLASYVVRAMKGTVDDAARLLDDGQVELASFLMTRRTRPFNRQDLDGWNGGSDHDVPFSAFRRYGIIKSERRGRETTWRMTNQALQRLDGKQVQNGTKRQRPSPPTQPPAEPEPEPASF